MACDLWVFFSKTDMISRARNKPSPARLGSVHERAEPGSAWQFGELAEEARLGSKPAREPVQNIYYAVSI